MVLKERHKDRDERFKRLIGQRDIGAFFKNPSKVDDEKKEEASQEINESEEKEKTNQKPETD